MRPCQHFCQGRAGVINSLGTATRIKACRGPWLNPRKSVQQSTARTLDEEQVTGSGIKCLRVGVAMEAMAFFNLNI